MAKTCENVSMYESLNFCKGKSVLPGIRPKVYYCSKDDIATWPKLPEAAKSKMSELATYEGAFVMGAEKKFHRIDLSLEKGVVEFEPQGEGESRTFLNKITLIHPEIDEDATAFCRQSVSDDLIFLVQQRNGKWRVVGAKQFPTIVTPKGTTGEGVTGQTGTTVEVQSTDVCPAPFYVGELDTDDGTIECGPATTVIPGA